MAQIPSGTRQEVHSPAIERRRELGQFLTPQPIADLMASLFSANWPELELLDPGAGTGNLTAALVRRLCAQRRKPASISVTAYELDHHVIGALNETLSICKKNCESRGIDFRAKILNRDFIADAAAAIQGDLFSQRFPVFNAAIVNPPYRKINSKSKTRLFLRSAGIETSNFYTGFVALITRLLSDGGELVSITPRSFCNGPYFKPFRRDFLRTMSLSRLHLFESRSKAFERDGVLQENLILHAIKEKARQKKILISSSSGRSEAAIHKKVVNYSDVVSPTDSEQFIHLPVNDERMVKRGVIKRLTERLEDLGLNVSTGRVVDFRVRSFLKDSPTKETVPLIYPCHFNGGFIHWPKPDSRKPNAIIRCKQTEVQLIPSNIYVLVKRFTAKEERRRLVACVYDPAMIHSPVIGFENHLNYFHMAGRGLSVNLAKGLAAFLNSTMTDMYFRRFSGHTQVNAADLKKLRYPGMAVLEHIGRKTRYSIDNQDTIDALVEREILRWRS